MLQVKMVLILVLLPMKNLYLPIYIFYHLVDSRRHQSSSSLQSELETRIQFRLLLADPRVDPSSQDNAAIILASSKGHSEIVQLLLADDRVDPSARNNAAIKWTSFNGHTEIIRLLLADDRVDPSARNNAAIRWASSYGHTEIVQLLLADPRVDQRHSRSDK